LDRRRRGAFHGGAAWVALQRLRRAPGRPGRGRLATPIGLRVGRASPAARCAIG